MALMDKRFHLAALAIQACWRGIRTRRESLEFMRLKRKAIWTISKFVIARQAAIRLKRKQEAASLLIQRYCRGHLVSKKFIR